MLETIMKTAWTFKNPVFPGEAKICLGWMHFRAPPAALKQNNYHNSPNVQPIQFFFGVYLSSWNATFPVIFSRKCTFLVFVIDIFHFSFFIFKKKFQRHMHSICVKYDIYTRQISVMTDVYISTFELRLNYRVNRCVKYCAFREKNCHFELSLVDWFGKLQFWITFQWKIQ